MYIGAMKEDVNWWHSFLLKGITLPSFSSESDEEVCAADCLLPQCSFPCFPSVKNCHFSGLLMMKLRKLTLV